MLRYLILVFCLIAVTVSPVNAITNPVGGNVGLEATISSPAPTKGATITTPVNGRNFSQLPVTISGLCPQGVLVKVFSNNIFIGAASCANGSYSLQVDLFSGSNELIVRNYDNLDQAGPDSNTVSVTYSDGSVGQFENRVSLTSTYAKRGANPGENLSWPIVISGGNGPYAISADWGDGKPAGLKSQAFAGQFNIDHIYDSAGIYRIIVKVSDAGGRVAYLQLIGVANGAVAATGSSTKDAGSSTAPTVVTRISPIPALVALPLLLVSFWLGRKYELKALRHRIEQSTAEEYR